MSATASHLESIRLVHQVEVPSILKQLKAISFIPFQDVPCNPEIASLLSNLPTSSVLKAVVREEKNVTPLRIGVFFSGGSAPGGHNVLAGLFDAIQTLTKQGALIGFLKGPEGVLKKEYKELTKENIDSYRNLGGFDLLGTGRTKIESKAQMQLALTTCKSLALNGLIVIGGDDSNTNAALLASYFLEKNCITQVIGVPKTIDGDLKNDFTTLSFGFDTACRVYAEMIGNICKD